VKLTIELPPWVETLADPGRLTTPMSSACAS